MYLDIVINRHLKIMFWKSNIHGKGENSEQQE